MEFSLNIKSMYKSFPVPCDIADKYINLATGIQIKALLLVMRELSDTIKPEVISEKLKISLTEAEDVLLFWVQCGILSANKCEPESAKKTVIINVELPSRTDVIMRGMEDDKIRLLLREAQLKFGRNLKNNESRLLVSLYDDYGMDVSVILLLLQHAVSENRANLSYIRSAAAKWIKAGVQTVSDGEKIISDEAREKLAWGVVSQVFGIESRKPSESESEFSSAWINDWNMSPEMLKAAYDICIDKKVKLSFPYVNKILQKWHSCGYKSVNDIKNDDKSTMDNKSKNDFAGFDLDAFEAKLNSD